MELVRLGPPTAGVARTVQRHGDGVEVLDSERVALSSWRQRKGAQRFLSVLLVDRDLEVFIPLETFLETGEVTLEEIKRHVILEGPTG